MLQKPFFFCQFFLLPATCCTDALGAVLAGHLDKPRVYIGCMKSGEVFSQPWVNWATYTSNFFGMNGWQDL